MKKLKLNLESLAVEAFETAAPVERRGTVEGYYDTSPESCDYRCESMDVTACTDQNTCAPSCYGTCYYSCYGTCNGPTCGACGEPTSPWQCPD